jgi:hypothetical protein
LQEGAPLEEVVQLMNATSRLCLSGLAAAGFMAAVSAPAHATLQIAVSVGGSTFFCADGMACDLNSKTGVLEIGTQTIDGVTVNGSIELSTGTPANPGRDLLSTTSLSIVNGSGAVRDGAVAISDTNFTGPVQRFDVTGSGSWVDALGSSTTYKWFDDPTNTQGASTAFDTPGILLDTFTSKGTSPLHSFSVDSTGAVSDSSRFSMTLQATAVLSPGASLLDRGQAEVKAPIPEPSTWAMIGLGFAALAFAGYRRARKDRILAFV